MGFLIVRGTHAHEGHPCTRATFWGARVARAGAGPLDDRGLTRWMNVKRKQTLGLKVEGGWSEYEGFLTPPDPKNMINRMLRGNDI